MDCHFMEMLLEKLVSTRGCVIRVGRVKYLVQWMVFACFKCRLQKLVRQSQEIYTLPKKCDVCGTENKGRVPKVLDVELMDDLVNVCMPGDDITLTGVIKDIYKEPNLFALLVHSLCPSIYGHEMIKAGLILSLFGGNAKRAQSRDDIHILLVGDPGLEPGALVLADQGCCCIDEFDKMCPQHQALLESMEQQSVTVAKSGLICSLPARTSILAAANPIGGQYDNSKTVTENLNISQPILSRFDLIFLLVDKPDEHFDSLLCNHIMTVHTNSHANSNGKVMGKLSPDNECFLKERLTLPLSTEIIPQTILRTYISYARQYVNPKLSVEAAAVLQNYYLELRSKNKQFSSIPIFNRQLEAMIRLTEARAKLELRVEATKSDALDVIDILQYAMIDKSENYVRSKLNSDDKGFFKSTGKESTYGQKTNIFYKRIKGTRGIGNYYDK
ncbi:hypothetical protein DMN91_011892 [Ooceraea biroi]|uniref:MCM C-terminal AAA(+) ATPase domain-containing protein n=1 Tax=Ooceraea biroi TaxID=2015173 RepID=A0A3L8D7T6_OOCBI|nr:hypothetical protein DMN91_011892 [Ooceraea biroi]